jgi:hypothetical protein
MAKDYQNQQRALDSITDYVDQMELGKQQESQVENVFMISFRKCLIS